MHNTRTQLSLLLCSRLYLICLSSIFSFWLNFWEFSKLQGSVLFLCAGMFSLLKSIMQIALPQKKKKSRKNFSKNCRWLRVKPLAVNSLAMCPPSTHPHPQKKNKKLSPPRMVPVFLITFQFCSTLASKWRQGVAVVRQFPQLTQTWCLFWWRET